MMSNQKNSEQKYQNGMIKRRQFIGGLGALCLAPGLVLAGKNGIEQLGSGNPVLKKQRFAKGERLVSAQGSKPESYSLSWVEQGLKQAQQSLSGFRGHGVCVHPTKANTVVMCSRRPGLTGIEVNLQSGKITHQFSCRPAYHMTGHACFSQDGKSLFSSESHYESGVGKIVIRDADNYQILDEYNSHGIGPHEIKLMPDAKTLVVANGGILTHPNTGRKKLNLPTMDSNLAYLDIGNGKLLEAARFSEAKASIRHIDVSEDGTVAIAMQLQRSALSHQNTIALCALHRQGQAVQALPAPEELYQNLNDYVGSVAINEQSRMVGFSSPRGNLVAFWHLDTKKLAGYYSLHDVCGLAVSQDEKYFVLSNSSGRIRYLDAGTLLENTALRQHFANSRWDNHMITMPII